jgi:Asp-tRNA(Asn)/Glu-tRNA(Gln) amidotransferase C subunit
MLGHLWAQMQHHICTGFGVSETTYGSTIEKLLYGIGQGSCASPILWALLNQLILTALEEKYDCIRLVAIVGVEEHVRPGDSFVDEQTCGVTDDDITSEPVSSAALELVEREEELIEQMEDIMQYFIHLLQVTGGDLAPENVHGSSSHSGRKMEKWYRPSKATKALT